MRDLEHEVWSLTHEYARKGGKGNRRQQRGRMLAFAAHAATLGAQSLGQVGRRHVISYWKTHRALAPTTAYHHWLALCELWRLAGKTDEPPRPRVMADHTAVKTAHPHRQPVTEPDGGPR